MSETRVVTPGNLGDIIFGFGEGLVGSIDDNTLKGNLIEAAFEFAATTVNFALSTTENLDFIGQQVLIGPKVYFLRDISSFNGIQWTWPPELNEQIYEDAFNASETVTVLFDFRPEQYTTPELVTPYGNQGTLVGDTIVAVDIGPNFVLANTVTATNLPPGLNISGTLITGTVTDNTGPFEVLVTATNSIGTTTATFAWNTYRLNTNTRIVTPGNSGPLFGFITGFIGSIDDDTIKGNTIGAVLEQFQNNYQMSVDIATGPDFYGQQFLVGETVYFLKDVESFSGTQWLWSVDFKGKDLEDAFNAAETVTVVFNINGVNTFLNSAINSDINTPIPFPSHFDNR